MRDTVYVEQLTSALYLTKRVDVDHYTQAMDLIATASTPPDQTKQFLRTVLAELGESRPARATASPQ